MDFSIRLQKYNNFLIEVLYSVQYLQNKNGDPQPRAAIHLLSNQ